MCRAITPSVTPDGARPATTVSNGVKLFLLKPLKLVDLQSEFSVLMVSVSVPCGVSSVPDAGPYYNPWQSLPLTS